MTYLFLNSSNIFNNQLFIGNCSLLIGMLSVGTPGLSSTFSSGDKDSKFDEEVEIKGEEISPMVTWGTSPEDVVSINGKIPNPDNEKNEDKKIECLPLK